MKTIILLCIGFALIGFSSAYSEEVQIETSDYTKIYPMFGIKDDSALGRMVSVGIGLRKDSDSNSDSEIIYFSQMEFGEDGNKFHVGFGAVNFGGIAAKASLLHTSGDPIGVEPDQTYVGVTGALNIIFLNLELGAYTHIAGEENDKDTLFTTTIGISWIF